MAYRSENFGMFPIFFSEISGMFPTVLTFPEKFASLLGINSKRIEGHCLMFVVGWTSTIESYYTSWSRSILDVALDRLTNNPSMTFVWAEIIFLQRWYEEQPEDKRVHFKKSVQLKSVLHKVP